MEKYQVIVGNIGTVYYGNDYEGASADFDYYVLRSKDGVGAASGESVTMFEDGEPVKEFYGKNDMGDTDDV